jgi:hypothetical protein
VAGVVQVMAGGAAHVHKFTQGYVYGLDTAMSQEFADHILKAHGYPVKVRD